MSLPNAPALTAFCPGCDQQVVAMDDGRCSWCDSQTGGCELGRESVDAAGESRLGRVCPDCDGEKSGGARRCWECSLAARSGNRAAVPASAYVCPALGPNCAGRKTPEARTCWPCYVDGGGHRGRKHRKGANTLQKITPELLEEAQWLYASGKSLRAVAQIVFPRTRYKTLASCAEGLFEAFKRRGWPLRDQRAATAAGNRARAWQLDCDHVIAGGERKGELCGRRAIGDDGKCWHHKPERIAEGIARLRRIDAQRRAR